MRFGRRSRAWAVAGRKLFGDRPGESEAGEALDTGHVATEERDALIEAAPEEDAMTPPEQEQMAAVDPTQRLLTALGRFQRQVTRAESGAPQEEWCDECMNQLITGIEIALEEGWGDVREALTDTARVLQTYENAGRAAACVPFLQDSYEILCLMVGDLIVDNVRSGVMRKWRGRYAGAVEELEGLGLELVDDGSGQGTPPAPEQASAEESVAEEPPAGANAAADEDIFGEPSPFDPPESALEAEEQDGFDDGTESPIEVTPDALLSLDEEAEEADEAVEEDLPPETADESAAFDAMLEEAQDTAPQEAPAVEAPDPFAEPQVRADRYEDDPFEADAEDYPFDAPRDGTAEEAPPGTDAPEPGVLPSLAEEMAQVEEEPADFTADEVAVAEETPETSPEAAVGLFDEALVVEPAPAADALPVAQEEQAPQPAPAPVAEVEVEPEEGTPEALLYHARSAYSRGDVADAKAMALELAARMADLEVDRAREELAEAERQLAEDDAAIARSEETVADAQRRLAEAEEQVQDRQGAFSAQRGASDELRGRIEAVQGGIADLDAQIEALIAQRDAQREEAAALQAEMDDATAEEGRIQSDIDATAQEEEACRVAVSEAEEGLAALRERRGGHQRAIARAERELGARRASLEGIRETIRVVMGVPMDAEAPEEAAPEARDEA